LVFRLTCQIVVPVALLLIVAALLVLPVLPAILG